MSEDRRPAPGDYDPYYADYIDALDDGPILARLVEQGDRLRTLLAGLGPSGADHRYAPDKWSIKEMIGHLADAERVFGMRATCIARGEIAPLPGFEQDDYVQQGGFGRRTLDSLLRELELLRGANVEMFAALSDEAWERRGTASGSPVTVRAIAWILAGHLEHHVGVLRDRYGDAFAG